MKTRYNFKWIGFLSNLRSKIAHKTCQFRASSHMEGKIKFSKRFDLKEKIFAFKRRSFFILFALIPHSINTQHIAQDQGRKTLALQQPLFCSKISQNCEIRI